MRLTSLNIRNYRTLESINLEFPSSYAAICGANDSGKTNVVRAIRVLFRGESTRRFIYPDQDELSLKDDFPKWMDMDPAKRVITFEITIKLDSNLDYGIYQFVTKQLSIEKPADPLELSITVTYRTEKSEPIVILMTGETKHTDLDAQQVLKTLQSSKSILFHNSTDPERGYFYQGGSVAGHIREIAGQHETLITKMKKTVNAGMSKISKAQQQEFEGLLGRLQTKYKVGLSLPAFDFGYLPYTITLGDKNIEVPLDDWGSGTKNRTLVLLALIRARQIRDTEPSASKITPIMVVEEPESFLHPSAQAEFGRILQDLAEEFGVQIVVTTHSPYLLNLKDPIANILLSRRTIKRQVRDTELIDTSGDNWMAPFGQALGLDAEAFLPWKGMLMAGSDSILLVEGQTDKEYFEMLRDEAHGRNRLVLKGAIVPYEGIGALCNTVLLRFVKNVHPRFFVTFDLDSKDKVEKNLKDLKMVSQKHYFPIGLNAPGKRDIEGLLPEFIRNTVYEANPDLVQVAMNGNGDERTSAKNNLKKLLLRRFKEKASPGAEYYGKFYELTKVINKALTKPH